MENDYESQQRLGQYLLFHYGTAHETLGDLPGAREALHFPLRCVTELLDSARLANPTQPLPPRALDLGCAVGRSSFELARAGCTVIGIDFSASFIQAAQTILEHGSLPYQTLREGACYDALTATRPEGIDPNQIHFELQDAQNLPETWEGFDVVFAGNLLCRLPQPQKLLQRFPQLVRPGGQLLLTTPFTWLEAFTPKENWLGSQDANSPDSFTGLQQALEPAFLLDKTCNLPSLIREHARKYDYGIALGSRWIRSH